MNKRYRITFYDESEEVIGIEYGRYDDEHCNELYGKTIQDYGCRDDMPIIERRDKVYGYIGYFKKYGRFQIDYDFKE